MNSSYDDGLQQMFGLVALGLVVWVAYAAQPEAASCPDDCGNPRGCERKLTVSNPSDNVELEPDELPPRFSEWAEKSARNYARAQEKKWRNWEKAMFQPKP